MSQSIKKQERRIGARLFDRTSRTVRLTPLGEQLYTDLRAAYGQIRTAIDAATAAARGHTATLTLGVFGPHAYELAAVIDRFRARNPHCEILFREVHFSDPFGPLRAGKVDLQTCWLLIREPDLTVGPTVLTDTLMLMVAAAHPLATRESVSLEDLADCVLPQVTPAVPAYWEAALIPAHTPSGRPIPRGPRVATFQEAQAVVAANQAVCVVFAEASRYYQRPGTVYLPIRGAPLGRWALIWRSANDNPLVRAFAQTAAAARSDRAATAGAAGIG
ncbi:LysR family transcriptional regulator [Micromonospora sp. DR5-3]|uniref:LysR family transcriptional regulator n=1 Tax=unclassified Micromonospora TaxID=2617518 RepID=UPI0011D67639|nr:MULTISPECIES: LysR family transcriptional regulator [unclassified Micromonospora]MCW3815095.1 LysR family transcriptional regulator [Micromonospora sp. DR5-3]TYC25404.1 LysR family transcriptional regulator [Micromonospora sp. MP36]